MFPVYLIAAPAKAAPAKAAPAKAAPAKKEEPKKAAPAKAAPAKAAPAKAAPAKAAPAKKEEPKKVAPAPVAEPAKEQTEAKTVKAVAAKPQPKKRGVNAKAAAASGKGRVSKKQLRGKGLKKKKIQLRFAIDCTNIAEDSIMDVADFVSILYFNRLYGSNVWQINSWCFHLTHKIGKILGRTHQSER